MKVSIKSLCSCLLFCLIFIVSGCFNIVYAADAYVGFIAPDLSDTGMYLTDKLETVKDSEDEDGETVTFNRILDLKSIAEMFTVDFCENMIKGEENHFADMNFIPQYKATGTREYIITHTDEETGEVTYSIGEKSFTETGSIADFKGDFLSYNQKDSAFTIQFTYKDVSYIFYTYADSFYEITDGGEDYDTVSKTASTGEKHELHADINTNTSRIFELFRDNSLLGIIAGSIGAGYNVGAPYSLTQKSLADIMDIKGNGYDFKNLRNIEFSFSYYYSPLFGQMYKEKEPFLPQTDEEWIALGISKADEFLQGSSVIIDPAFLEYRTTLSEDNINEKGEKISDKKINGAKRIAISGSKDPKSVITYSMPINVPYLFEISGGKGRLVTNSLREMDNYVLSIYNNNIYSVSDTENTITGEAVTDLTSLGINRKDIFLYYKDIPIGENSETETETETETEIETETETETGTKNNIANITSLNSVKKGIVIIASFDECIVDTTEDFDSTNPENNLYLTGRKITLDNGYSDALDYKNLEGNVDLMAVRGGTDQLGPYPPRFVSFPAPGIELKGFSLYHALGGEVEEINPDMAEKIKEVVAPMSEEESFEYINDKEMHGNLPETTSVVRYFINFGPIKTGIGYTSDTVDNSKEIGKYSLYIVRNNAYINDSLLLDWLKTSEAQAMTHVNAELLIQKITGDFTNNLGKLSYEDWLKIQEIRGEFDYYKSTWLIRTINVMSLVLGAFLIIFGILFIGLYWFDIFNTLTDFSCLQFITHGSLYPVTDKDFAPYLPDSGNTKFVTFFDVLILALIMIFVGILLINSQFIIDLIIRVFNYLSYTVGGF